MQESIPRWTHTLLQEEIRLSDCNAKREVMAQNLMGFFQNTAEEDMEQYPSLTRSVMREKGLAWMISQISCCLLPERPQSAEQIVSETWSPQIKGIYFHRNHALWRQERKPEQIFALASSKWFVVDKLSRKILRPSELLQAEEALAVQHEWPALQFKSQRLKSPFPAGELTAEDYNFYRPRPVEYSFVDINQHLNNIYYLAFSLDLAAAYLAEQGFNPWQFVIREFHLNYLLEVLPFQTLDIYLRVLPEMESLNFQTKIGASKLNFSPSQQALKFALEGRIADSQQTAYLCQLILEEVDNCA